MMVFVVNTYCLEHFDSFLNGRLTHYYWLEAALQGRVFLYMFAVFIKGCRTNTTQFAAGQGWLQHISRTDSTLSCTSTNHCVQFVDKDDDIIGLAQFFQYGFDALFKLSTEHSTGNHTANA